MNNCKLQHFVRYYNYERYHESLNNLTPADVFYGRDVGILNQRRKLIKQNTLVMSKLLSCDKHHNPMN